VVYAPAGEKQRGGGIRQFPAGSLANSLGKIMYTWSGFGMKGTAALAGRATSCFHRVAAMDEGVTRM
jgi:hypothetical protein